MAEKRGADFGSSWVASGDMTGQQYRPLTSNVANIVVTFATTGAYIAGINQDKKRNGEHVGLIGSGYSKVFAAGSLGVGGEFMGAPAGVVLVGSGQFCGGHVLTACVSGDITDAMIVLHRKGAL